jgi:hypothetical protein
MKSADRYIRWFRDIKLSDIAQVGGKTASLGELYNELSGEGVRVPNGFAGHQRVGSRRGRGGDAHRPRGADRGEQAKRHARDSTRAGDGVGHQ